ncbi:hypothetical protein J2794_006404 [Paraburkholderia terricola]|nr:hypothetical protein [Paraburkholderia terricola]
MSLARDLYRREAFTGMAGLPGIFGETRGRMAFGNSSLYDSEGSQRRQSWRVVGLLSRAGIRGLLSLFILTDQTLRDVGKKGDDLVALELLPQDGLAMLVNTVHLKYIFRQVDTNGRNLHSRTLLLVKVVQHPFHSTMAR